MNGREITAVRQLGDLYSNHGYQPLTTWDDPPSIPQAVSLNCRVCRAQFCGFLLEVSSGPAKENIRIKHPCECLLDLKKYDSKTQRHASC